MKFKCKNKLLVCLTGHVVGFFYDYSGEMSRVHTRLEIPETRTFRVGNLQLGLPPDVMGPCT